MGDQRRRALRAEPSCRKCDPVGVVGQSEPAAASPTRRTSRRVFAGRGRELDTLEDELARARGGDLRVVLVTGEPGIGKTALATELAANAGDDVLVLTARAHGFGTSTPFGLWTEALERYLRTLDAPSVLRLVGNAAPELAPLLRSVEASEPGRATRRVSGYQLVESVVGLIAGVAADRPCLVVLDDVHLADSASWETLHFLARDRPTLQALVVATARADELADHPTANDVAFALEQDGLLRRVRLGPLDRDELAELARQRTGHTAVPSALVTWLESRSRGNALFATGLLGALLDRSGDLSAPALTAVPEELGERVHARLRDLDDDARAVLEVLAVVGARTELADLARIAGRPVDVVAVALEGVVKRKLATEDVTGSAATFELAHPLVQDAIYESIGAARRIRLHRAIGRTLLASGHLGAAAAHLARSATSGDHEAVDALIAALRDAEARSLYRDVTAILAEIMRLLPAGDARWLDVLRAMDPAADWVLAHLAEDGVADAVRAMRLIEPVADRDGDDRLKGLVQLRLACFAGLGTGELDDALAACERAAELFDRAGEPALALAARAEAPFVLTVRGEHVAALARTEALLPVADALGDVQARLHLLMHLSYQLPYLGQPERAAEAEERAMELAAKTGNHYRAALFRNRHRLLLAGIGRLQQARAMGSGTWDSPAAPDALSNEVQTVVDWFAGDLDGALRAVAKARVRNRTSVSHRQSMFLCVGARAAVDADLLDGVTALVQQAQEVNRGFGGVFAAYPDWAAAVLAWRFDNEDAVVMLRAAAERIRTLDVPLESLLFLLDLVEAAVERRDEEAARWAAEEAAAALRSLARFPFLAALEQLVVAIATRQPQASHAAASTFGELGYRLLRGRAQLAMGRSLALDEKRAAVEALKAAAATFRECGASWGVTRTVDVLRALGSHGRQAAAATLGPAAISDRESEVARLAASGLTAREIAERLFIGERTVETHLRNVYAKLGVANKRELVLRAAELGLRT